MLKTVDAFLRATLVIGLCGAPAAPAVGGGREPPALEVDLSRGWRVLQDVHDLGEKLEIYREKFHPTAIGPAVSEWEPLERLVHLQLLLAKNPYFGRELRYFNQHPWWYKLEFGLPAGAEPYATLRFTGADYFARVWLNEHLLGEHEGYFAPFEFEVGKLLRRDRPNVLVVKVWSPWDEEVVPGKERARFWSVVRRLVKGTYEHADTLIQRDVNPVGLWGKVSLRFHAGVRFSGRVGIRVSLDGPEQTARVRLRPSIVALRKAPRLTLRARVREADTGIVAASTERSLRLDPGREQATLDLKIVRPKLWKTWDRGRPALYRATIELISGGKALDRVEERFGVRTVGLRRTAGETTFYLNGRRIFLRGTNYFPDVYVSNMTRERYLRDLTNIRRAGCNAVRVHVHVEQDVFYDLCDQLGLAVIQDSGLNWTHPTTEEWSEHALRVVGDMIRRLRNHPSIIAWILMNEPPGKSRGEMMTRSPGPQLYVEAKRLDPERPVIKGSGASGDLLSGDSHNYTGSLNAQTRHYTEIYGQKEKLNTEFGFDAPPEAWILRRVPKVYRRLQAITDEIPAIQEYQYRLLKYFIEHYRITKYRPCSGYFQFLFIDISPQSFYGVYDWWGLPKKGLRALEESNQPVGVFMEYADRPVALWAVNDLPTACRGCRLEWRVSDDSGKVVEAGRAAVTVPADSAVRVRRFCFSVDPAVRYRVALVLRNSKGEAIARNRYEDPFHHPPRPPGHPSRVSHELGMRLYNAP